jgi:hypothetical protein
MHDNVPFRVTHGNRRRMCAAHHHAFKHRLSPVREFQFTGGTFFIRQGVYSWAMHHEGEVLLRPYGIFVEII